LSRPASSNAENASADNTSAHCEDMKRYISRVCMSCQRDTQYCDDNLPCNCSTLLHSHLHIVHGVNEEWNTWWIGWIYMLVKPWLTCKNMAKSTQESVLRQRSKNLGSFCNFPVNIIHGHWSTGIISRMQLHIYTSETYLQRNMTKISNNK
jgi:hypothetical protein